MFRSVCEEVKKDDIETVDHLRTAAALLIFVEPKMLLETTTKHKKFRSKVIVLRDKRLDVPSNE